LFDNDEGGKDEKPKRFFYSLILFITALVLTSCAASTILTSVWKDENYRIGDIKKVLIIVSSEKQLSGGSLRMNSKTK